MSLLRFLFLVVIAGLIRVRLMVGIVLALLLLGTLAFAPRGSHSALLFGGLLAIWTVLRVRRFVRQYRAKRNEGYDDYGDGDE